MSGARGEEPRERHEVRGVMTRGATHRTAQARVPELASESGVGPADAAASACPACSVRWGASRSRTLRVLGGRERRAVGREGHRGVSATVSPGKEGGRDASHREQRLPRSRRSVREHLSAYATTQTSSGALPPAPPPSSTPHTSTLYKPDTVTEGCIRALLRRHCPTCEAETRAQRILAPAWKHFVAAK